MSGKVDTAADPHQSLLGWTGLLSKARADTVLICQPNDSTVAHIGELSAETLKLKGVRGYVADGGCRDASFIPELGFPVWCRYLTPRDIVGYWLPDRFDQPIRIGGVTIHAGHLVLGDRDGMVILAGSDPQEAHLR